MKRLVRIIFPLMLVLSMLLTACGGAATEAPSAEEPVVEEATCGTVELAYWNPFTGPDGPYMGKMVDDFNASHPDIKVTMNSMGEYYRKAR